MFHNKKKPLYLLCIIDESTRYLPYCRPELPNSVSDRCTEINWLMKRVTRRVIRKGQHLFWNVNTKLEWILDEPWLWRNDRRWINRQSQAGITRKSWMFKLELQSVGRQVVNCKLKIPRTLLSSACISISRSLLATDLLTIDRMNLCVNNEILKALCYMLQTTRKWLHRLTVMDSLWPWWHSFKIKFSHN